MGNIINSVFCKLLLLGLCFVMSYGQMTFIKDKQNGILTIYEGKRKVLTYCFGDQLKKETAPEQIRSCYIHPLFSLDGEILTDDFPEDHPHHHGVFWTWPVVRTRGKHTQTWHPDTPSLRQHFNQWRERKTANKAFVLSVENLWKLNNKVTVAREILTLRIYPAHETGRVVDIELMIEAVGGDLELQGTPAQNKGYGGLSFRGAPVFKGAVMTTDQGTLKKDTTHQPFHWADLSTEKTGVAVFVSPDHPDFPPNWLIRNSYAGILNVSWPGLRAVVLQPGDPVFLRYRIYIHKGDVKEGRVKKAYDRYVIKHE